MAKKSLKKKFSIFAIICLLVLGLVFLISYYLSYKIVKAEINSKLTEEVLKNASEINDWFEGQSCVLHTMVRSLEYHHDFTNAYVDGYLRQMLTKDSLVVDYYLGPVDPGEKFISATGWNVPPGYDWRTTNWYQEAMMKNGLIFTIPYLDADSNKMIVTIAEPVRRNDRIIGVIGADILVTDLMELARQVKGNGVDYAFLLDQEFNFLVHPHSSLQPSPAGLQNASLVMGGRYLPLLRSIRQGTSSIVEIQDYDGVDKYFIVSQVESSNWAFGVAISKQEYLKPLNRLLGVFIISLVLALILGMGIISYFVNGLLQPIKTLREAVQSFARKDFSARVSVYSADEIGELGDCFNIMAATIEDYHDKLEDLVAERTKELEEKNQNIMNSIDYARRIQQSILPDFNKDLGVPREDYFVIWMPRDAVGGDAYWSRRAGPNYFLALFDCTGHGVPGALMTMTVKAILDRIIDEVQNHNPGRILQELNRLLQDSLRQNSRDALTNDGVDLGLCLVKPEQNRLVYAGSKITLYCCLESELTEIKGDRQSLGYKKSKTDYTYSNNEIELKPGQVFFLTTDGMIDQNEENGAAFGQKRFRRMILDNCQLSLSEQKQIYLLQLEAFMGGEAQRDDITMIGFKISASW